MHRHTRREEIQGWRDARRESQNKTELLIVPSAPAIVKEKAPDKVKCHHLESAWRVPWLILLKGHSGCHLPFPPTFIKIHHRCHSPRVRFIWSKHMQKNWQWTGMHWRQSLVACTQTKSRCSAFSDISVMNKETAEWIELKDKIEYKRVFSWRVFFLGNFVWWSVTYY